MNWFKELKSRDEKEYEDAEREVKKGEEAEGKKREETRPSTRRGPSE